MARAGAALLLFVLLLSGPEARAVVQGHSSSLHHFTVRLVGGAYCTGVVIGRRLVATAAHCGRGVSVALGGRSYSVAGASRSAILDDGRKVEVSGDAAILRLARDLPNVSPATVGPGRGDSFTIAGYGTTSERGGGLFGRLHEAWLVAAEPFALVDPERAGPLSPSACFGDSGGPVLRGGELVGIITRAAHPWPHIACGHLTRWAPITVSGEAATPVQVATVATYTGHRPQRSTNRPRITRGVEVGDQARPGWHPGRTSIPSAGRPRKLQRRHRAE
jgi:hypothetical protein